VTYKASASLGMLVPSEMEERYTTKFTTVTAVAEYSDYRLFRVDLKSAIDPNSTKSLTRTRCQSKSANA
jgi:hypothetical protein